MATKGSAGKSASGASMSKYDVEVEARLNKIEDQVGGIPNIEGMINSLVAQVSELQAQVSGLQSGEASVGGDVEAAVRALVRPTSLNPTADELEQ